MRLSQLLPIIAFCFFFWVFNKPMQKIALMTYDYSGALVQNFFGNIEEATEDAANLLSAEEELKKLRRENQELRIEKNFLVAELRSKANISRALAFKKHLRAKTIAAKVSGRSPDNWHKQIIINKGSKDGLSVGQGVVSEKAVIGQISKVGLYSSIVELIHNNSWKMGVRIKRTGQLGVLNGNYPGPGYVDFIAVDSDVKVGDEVLSSGICLDQNNCPYPEAFPVGIVTEVIKDPDVVDLVVKVEFIEDLQKLREVFVII